MAERVHPVTAVVEPDALDGVADLAPFEVPSLTELDAVRAAVRDAREGTGLVREAAAAALNARLAALTASEAHGQLLLELLAGDTLTGLTDEQGRSCRREAVRALLRLGFPWALQIEPETLAWFREAEAAPRRRRRALLVVLALVGALGGSAGLTWLGLGGGAAVPMPVPTLPEPALPAPVPPPAAPPLPAPLAPPSPPGARSPSTFWATGRDVSPGL